MRNADESSELEENEDPQFGPRTLNALKAYLGQVSERLQQQDTNAGPDSNTNVQTPIIETSSNTTERGKMLDFLPSLFSILSFIGVGGLAVWMWKFTQEIDTSQKTLENRLKSIDQRLSQQDQYFNKYSQSIQSLGNTINQQDQRVRSMESSVSQQRDILAKTRQQDTYATQNVQAGFTQKKVPERKTSTTALEIAKQYNQDPKSIAATAVGVSQTEESLKQNLQNSSNTNVILAQDPSPNYWIIVDTQNNYWLLPREGWEPSIGTVESFGKLFRFTGNMSHRFKVRNPASVIAISQNEWSLKEMGEVEFG